MCSSVVSTRISKKDRDTLKRAGIDIAKESRKHLEQVAADIRRRQSIERLNKTIDKLMPAAARGYAARSVREDRENN
jgi:ribosome biogenesis protein Tsr3